MAKEEYYTCDLTGTELLDISDVKAVRTVPIKPVGNVELDDTTKYHVKKTEVPQFFLVENFVPNGQSTVERAPYFIHGTRKGDVHVKSSYKIVAWAYPKPSGLGKGGNRKLVVNSLMRLGENSMDFVNRLEEALRTKDGS